MKKTTSPSGTPKYRVPSVDSACRILRRVSMDNRSVHLQELVQVAGTSRTTALRITSSLVDNDFLTRVGKSSFEPGSFLRELGERRDLKRLISSRAKSILEAIAESSEETAHLALPMDQHCILEGVAQSPRPIRVASKEGSLVDYHCSATGKSILAFDETLRRKARETIELRQRTKNTICDWPALESELDRTKDRGYAIDEQEYHEGVRCVAIPLIDDSGSVLGAIGITGAATTLTKRRIPQLVRTLKEAANELLKSPKT